MPTNDKKNHIYDKKIRKYEEEIIKFFVEYGKNKRSEIESHLLAYFFLREGQWLTQDNLREISIIFYEIESKKGISKGSISKILNNYIGYGVIKKRKLENKKNAYEYSISGVNQVMSSAIEYGVEKMGNYISFLKLKLISLEKLKYKKKELESLRVDLINRITELIDFFIFQKTLYEDVFKIPENKLKKETRKDELESIQVKKSLRDIEREIIKFIVNCPVLRFVKIKESYYPIIAYFFTRKRLTQEELNNLSGFSAGMISECLNYMLEEELIRLIKFKGVRMRFYELGSIAYYIYQQLYQIFKNNFEIYSRLDILYNELKSKRMELKDIEGYPLLKRKVKQFLNAKPFIEKLLIRFKEAKIKFG